jgi:hypothetical protein
VTIKPNWWPPAPPRTPRALHARNTLCQFGRQVESAVFLNDLDLTAPRLRLTGRALIAARLTAASRRGYVTGSISSPRLQGWEG